MSKFMIACSTITWGRGTPQEQMLAEIAQAGYEGAPAGPRLSAQETIELFKRYGLTPGSGYLGADFWNPEQEEAILERARHQAQFMHDIGCTELYVAAGGFGGYVTARGKTRNQIAATGPPRGRDDRRRV